MPKPTVFIGSSSEQLATAEAIKQCLDPHEATVTVWNEGVFNLGQSTLDDLLKAVEEFDFAVFVFAPEDLTRMRAVEQPSVRANVVFELGLFMGRLGKQRCFWVV